jgi:hypothetical protein
MSDHGPYSDLIILILLSRMSRGNASLACRHDFLRRAVAAIMGQL